MGMGLSLGVGLTKGGISAPGWIIPGASLDMAFYQSLYYGAQVSSLTVARALTAYAQTSAGLLTSFGSNVARITDLGLLVEEQRQNLILRSEEIDNAVWTKSSTSVTANQTTAPNGTLTADLVSTTAASAAHAVYGTNVSVVAAVVYTVSAFIKGGTCRYVSIRGETQAAATYPWITVDTQAGTVAGNASVTAASITALANGWYRVAMTYTNFANIPSGNMVIAGDTSATPPVGGTVLGTTYGGGDNFYVWGVQFEVGAFASSYIPTANTNSTRPADAITMTSTAFSGWYTSQAPMSMYAETNVPQVNSSVAYRAWEVDNASASAQIRNSSGSWIGEYNTDGSASGGSIVANSTQKIAMAMAANDLAVCLNGGTVGTDATVTALTGVNRATLGASTLTASVYLNGYLRRIAYFPSRLANATLQSITT